MGVWERQKKLAMQMFKDMGPEEGLKAIKSLGWGQAEVERFEKEEGITVPKEAKPRYHYQGPLPRTQLDHPSPEPSRTDSWKSKPAPEGLLFRGVKRLFGRKKSPEEDG